MLTTAGGAPPREPVNVWTLLPGVAEAAVEAGVEEAALAADTTGEATLLAADVAVAEVLVEAAETPRAELNACVKVSQSVGQ